MTCTPLNSGVKLRAIKLYLFKRCSIFRGVFGEYIVTHHRGSISREKWGGWETGDLGTDVNNGTTLPLQHLGQELVSHLGCGRGQLDHVMSRDSHMTNLPQLQQKCFRPRSGAISATEKGNYFKTL